MNILEKYLKDAINEYSKRLSKYAKIEFLNVSDEMITNNPSEKEIEQIEEIERFIDREYYEVLPQFVIENPANVLSEITMDLN